jgi:hypothetical protein
MNYFCVSVKRDHPFDGVVYAFEVWKLFFNKKANHNNGNAATNRKFSDSSVLVFISIPDSFDRVERFRQSL